METIIETIIINRGKYMNHMIPIYIKPLAFNIWSDEMEKKQWSPAKKKKYLVLVPKKPSSPTTAPHAIFC